MARHFDIKIDFKILRLAFFVFFREVWFCIKAEIVTVEPKTVKTQLFENVEATGRGCTSSADNG